MRNTVNYLLIEMLLMSSGCALNSVVQPGTSMSIIPDKDWEPDQPRIFTDATD
jgi:hypothetical protein